MLNEMFQDNANTAPIKVEYISVIEFLDSKANNIVNNPNLIRAFCTNEYQIAVEEEKETDLDINDKESNLDYMITYYHNQRRENDNCQKDSKIRDETNSFKIIESEMDIAKNIAAFKIE